MNCRADLGFSGTHKFKKNGKKYKDSVLQLKFFKMNSAEINLQISFVLAIIQL